LAVKVSRKKGGAGKIQNSDERKNQNVDQHD
jgi:hypothetical protein